MPPVLNQPRANGVACPLALECQDQRSNDAWDEFVESLPDGHHEQTSRWGEVRAKTGWQVGRTICRENGAIVAGFQMLTRPIGRFGRLAYVTYGPCLERRDPMLEEALAAGLKEQARRMDARFMVVGLPYDGQDLVPGFVAAGFQRKPTRFPPHFLEATTVIDLSREPEEIFSAMHRSKRRNVRHGLKTGIRVVEQTGENLGEFHQLMLALCQRRNTTPNPAQLEFFTLLWQRFQPKGWVRLFFARLGSEPVSAALAFTFGDWFRVWKVGWSGQHAHLKPNDTLWWQMILQAHRDGFRRFDFVGIDPAEAKHTAGAGPEEDGRTTVTSFKLGFGGECRFLPGAYYYIFNPVWRTLCRHGLGRWLDSPLFLKAAGPLLGQLSHG